MLHFVVHIVNNDCLELQRRRSRQPVADDQSIACNSSINETIASVRGNRLIRQDALSRRV